MTITWLIFETLGTIAFAFSGAVVGLSRRMDIFGITVLAVMTGVGGGMVRDVLCGITPPSVLRSPDGLFVSIITALIILFSTRSIAYRRRMSATSRSCTISRIRWVLRPSQ